VDGRRTTWPACAWVVSLSKLGLVFAPQLTADYYYRPLTQLLLADVVFTTLLPRTHCHHTWLTRQCHCSVFGNCWKIFLFHWHYLHCKLQFLVAASSRHICDVFSINSAFNFRLIIIIMWLWLSSITLLNSVEMGHHTFGAPRLWGVKQFLGFNPHLVGGEVKHKYSWSRLKGSSCYFNSYMSDGFCTVVNWGISKIWVLGAHPMVCKLGWPRNLLAWLYSVIALATMVKAWVRVWKNLDSGVPSHWAEGWVAHKNLPVRDVLL